MAVKIEDGDGYDRGTWAASVEALRQAGVLDGQALRVLARYHRPTILDPHGRVGRRGDRRVRARAGGRADRLTPHGCRRPPTDPDATLDPMAPTRSVSHARPDARRVARRGQARLSPARQGEPSRRGRRGGAAALPRDPGRLRAARRRPNRGRADAAERRPAPHGRRDADPGRRDASRLRRPGADAHAGAGLRAGRRPGRARAGRERGPGATAPARRAGRRTGRRHGPDGGRAGRPGAATPGRAPATRRPSEPRTRRRSARPPTTAPTTSRSSPTGAGASWYGTTSGTYWTINPKEYADPRKHGPEYQARARAGAPAGRRPRARGTAATPARRTGRRAAGSAATSAPSVRRPGDARPRRPTRRHTTSSWWDATAGRPAPGPRRRPRRRPASRARGPRRRPAHGRDAGATAGHDADRRPTSAAAAD